MSGTTQDGSDGLIRNATGAQFDCPVLLDVNDISLKYIVSGFGVHLEAEHLVKEYSQLIFATKD